MNSDDFAAAYAWLHPEQQRWVSPERFRACYATLSRFSPAAKLLRAVRAERALAEMCARVQERVAFGKPIAEQGVVQEWIADSRIEIDQARLLTRHAAWLLDEAGTKGEPTEISAIKVVAPTLSLIHISGPPRPY